MKTVLFIDRNQLVTRTVVGGNINPDKLMPHVYTAQNKFIWPILGTVLYEKLQSDVINGTLTGVYQKLIDEYITDTLVHYAVAEYLPWSLYQFGEGGTMMSSPEFNTNPNKKDIDFILQKELQSAQFFAERLTDYLIANSPDYPEYWETNGKSDNIYPDKSQKYNCGWTL
jgi:hypothetical protein